MSLLAHIDLQKWIQVLQKSLGVEIPEALDHEGDDAVFARRFLLDLQVNGDHEKDERNACEQLPCLFDDETPRVQHWRQLTDRIASSIEDGSGLVDLDVSLRVQPSFRSLKKASLFKQCERLRSVTAVVSAIKKLQDRQHSDTNAKVKMLLESLDLDLSLLRIHEATFKEITGLVQTVALVNVLTLPNSLAVNPGRRRTELREAWAFLVCRLCDYRPCGPAAVGVAFRRVVLLEFYSTNEDFFAAFFSALHDSRRIQKLNIVLADSTNQSENVVLAPSFWAWVAFALFSSSSTSSVEVLDLSGIELTTSSLDTMKRSIHAENAAQVLYEVTTGATAPPSLLPRSVVMRMGTDMQLLGMGLESRSFRLPFVWTGVEVDENEAKANTTVLLPGFGFCLFDENCAEKIKRRRSNAGGSKLSSNQPSPSRRRLHTLSMSSGRRMALSTAAAQSQIDLVARFVELIGSGLIKLNLGKYPLIQDDALVKCLTACPQLMNLRVAGCGFSPDRLFSLANARGSCLSSLEFVGLTMPRVNVERFLRLLIVEDPATTCVRKLRIRGLRTVGNAPSVAAYLAQHLRDQSPLTHLRVSVSSGARVLKTLISPRRGQTVPMGPLPLRHRLAFVTCQVGANDAFCRLGQDSLALVFAFAAPTTTRRIVVEEEKRQPNLWWH